ncbi:helix-turn-helix transcriptional regulator [Streptomyces sp. CA-210063]|uniref:helix-turn-helix domain-containing protein n=1 Tax=Streptomyces sp. CA-210063 TaxID=2801029 RepID=UPI00214B9E7F|nr:helix-turn-helix transcriptional regulator [Streptomyces sp. CA-210063]UUU33007.1 helix-turn-helix transcriptional regulator [Streptomyces sp. CA-210063]
MPKPKTLDPSESTRALYGAELRHQRERAGMSQEDLGAAMFVSGSFVGQLEAGLRRMRLEYARSVDEILGTDGFFVRNLEAARKSPYEHHFADVVEFEGLAQTIKEWGPTLVPGLLQTAAYTRAVVRAYDPVLTEDIVEERVAARQARAHIFDDPRTPRYWAILDEMALRRPVGGPAGMAEQLRHIAGMVRRHRIIVQVLPLAEGATAGMQGMFKLMTFEDAPPLSYTEGSETGRLFDDPAVVTRSVLTYDLLGGAALSPGASLALIEQAAKEYEDAHRSRPEDRDLA